MNSHTVSTASPATAAAPMTRVRVMRSLDDRGLAVREDRPVRHVASRLRAVPVLRVRWYEGDIARAHGTLLRLVGHGALTLGDDEDLIARVHVPLVRRAVLEVHLGEPEILARVLAHRGLVIDVAAEDRIRAALATRHRDPFHPHAKILS